MFSEISFPPPVTLLPKTSLQTLCKPYSHHLQGKEGNVWKNEAIFLPSHGDLWHSWEQKAMLQLSRHIPYSVPSSCHLPYQHSPKGLNFLQEDSSISPR